MVVGGSDVEVSPKAVCVYVFLCIYVYAVGLLRKLKFMCCLFFYWTNNFLNV